jgi:DNA-binding MarR family transcriptional regulator
MGQQEVYDYLRDNPGRWYTSRQIADALTISIGSVTMSLKKLRKTNIIEFKSTGSRNTFKYSITKTKVKA